MLENGPKGKATELLGGNNSDIYIYTIKVFHISLIVHIIYMTYSWFWSKYIQLYFFRSDHETKHTINRKSTQTMNRKPKHTINRKSRHAINRKSKHTINRASKHSINRKSKTQ